jgi:hypothetical protein
LPRLRIPALILLLPVGFALGVIAPQLRMDAILGPAFPVLVYFVVAVILCQCGMELNAITLQGSDRRIVHRRVWVGGAHRPAETADRVGGNARIQPEPA